MPSTPHDCRRRPPNRRHCSHGPGPMSARALHARTQTRKTSHTSTRSHGIGEAALRHIYKQCGETFMQPTCRYSRPHVLFPPPVPQHVHGTGAQHRDAAVAASVANAHGQRITYDLSRSTLSNSTPRRGDAPTTVSYTPAIQKRRLRYPHHAPIANPFHPCPNPSLFCPGTSAPPHAFQCLCLGPPHVSSSLTPWVPGQVQRLEYRLRHGAGAGQRRSPCSCCRPPPHSRPQIFVAWGG